MNEFEQRDRAFIALPFGVPSPVVKGTVETIAQSGLTPIVYQGVVAPSEGRTSSAYTQAIADLYESRVLVCVVVDGDRQEWLEAEIPHVVEQGLAVWVYVVRGSKDINYGVPDVQLRLLARLEDLPAAVSSDLQSHRG